MEILPIRIIAKYYNPSYSDTIKFIHEKQYYTIYFYHDKRGLFEQFNFILSWEDEENEIMHELKVGIAYNMEDALYKSYNIIVTEEWK